MEQEKKAKTTKLSSPAPAATPSPATPSSTLPTSNGGPKKKFTGDAETRKFDTDGVDTKRTDSQTRNSCIGLIYNGLAYRSTESPSDVIARAVSVENAAFVKYKGETPEYKKKIRSLFSNLKDKSNKELGLRVMAGTIAPEKFVVMTDEELKSESLRKLDNEAEEENIKNAQMAKGEKSYSDSLECGRCKKKMVSYTQAQTRSADEPMTTFCECMNCGKRWKASNNPILLPFILHGNLTLSNSSRKFSARWRLSLDGNWRRHMYEVWKRSFFGPYLIFLLLLA